jgi:sporulation protein YlmC with PRC-barrel domain
MKNKHMMVALLAGSLTLATSLKGGSPPDPAPPATPSTQPEPGQAGQLQPGRTTQEPRRPESAPEHSYLGATHIIGREVCNDVGERLGTVKDLIVSLDSDTARFAIIKYGGTLGFGATRVAVPLKDLKWSAEQKLFSMAASKEQLQSASPVPTGGWMSIAGQDWAGRVDRFYGDPEKGELSQAAPPSPATPDDSREFVRDPAPPEPEPAIGLEHQLPSADTSARMPLSKPADAELLANVTKLVEQYAGPAAGGDVQATVDNGAVTLKGRIATAAQKEDLENRIKALSGVWMLIDDQLLAAKAANE